ncbi:AraC family transcriptional regulator [Phytomonospora sp. NPDC050363]|uniref:AraC family transcriptional regulator n=1 Tax=Phytomonospora sp. NPDC050363 TaxID=3155642 RepID=UPI0033C8B9E0
MAGPRKDTRGIVAPGELMARVRFRRFEPARPLRRYVDNYWFIDWDLDEPYESRVVPHPSVNLAFERFEGAADFGGVNGIEQDLFSIKLYGVGRVCGAKFRPGGFRPFHGQAAGALNDRRIPLDEVFPGTADATAKVLDPPEELARVAAFDELLLSLAPKTPDPLADKAMELMDRVRVDRSVQRVDEFAALAGMSVRGLQRLFADYVGISPKWAIMRYRIHEAVELAGADADWARLAADLGYSDQAHLVRDFTATLGVPPAAFVRATATTPV